MKAYRTADAFWLTDGKGRDLASADSQGELELKMAALGVRLSGDWRQVLSLRPGFLGAVWAADVEEERG